METIEQLKIHYRWNTQVEEHLKSLQDFGEKYKEQFIEGFYSYLENFEDMRKYFPNESVLGRQKEKLKNWFVALFSGRYDNEYMRKLYRVGGVHVKLGLPLHYVIASMNFVRLFLSDRLTQEFGRSKERDEIMASVDKALDINLDVITSSYREEELKLYLASGKFQKLLIESVRRASSFFDFFVIVAFAFVGSFLIARIGYEIFTVLKMEVSPEHGAISILGSLLILYAVLELLGEELRHIRGGALGLRVFVAVALAAIIRKVIILSLSPEQMNELLILAVLILSLGVTYWLIHKAEEKKT